MTKYSEYFSRQATWQKKAALISLLTFFVGFGSFAYFAQFDSGV